MNTQNVTVQEAKIYLRENFNKGVNCLCCGQFVKLYKRKLNSGMARTLIRIWRHHKSNPVNVKDFLRKHSYSNNHDWTLLRYWGLIKQIPGEEDPAKKDHGVWKITNHGLDFLENKYRIPSHVHIFNAKLIGFSETTTNIKEALGKKFDYQELMQK